MANLPASLCHDLDFEPIPVRSEDLINHPLNVQDAADPDLKRRVLSLAYGYIRTGSLQIFSAQLRGPFEDKHASPWIKRHGSKSLPQTTLASKANISNTFNADIPPSKKRSSPFTSPQSAKRNRLITPEDAITSQSPSTSSNKKVTADDPNIHASTPDKVPSSLPTPAGSKDRSFHSERTRKSPASPTIYRTVAQSSPLRRNYQVKAPRPFPNDRPLQANRANSQAPNRVETAGLMQTSPFKVPVKACQSCGKTDSKQWKKGPDGPATLCCSCSGKWAYQKSQRKIEAGIVRGLKSAGWHSPGKKNKPHSSNMGSQGSGENGLQEATTSPPQLRRSSRQSSKTSSSTPISHEDAISKIFPKDLASIERIACREAVNLRQKTSPNLLKWQGVGGDQRSSQACAVSGSFTSIASTPTSRRPIAEKRQRRRVDLGTPQAVLPVETASEEVNPIRTPARAPKTPRSCSAVSSQISPAPATITKTHQSTQALMDNAFTEFRDGLQSTKRPTTFFGSVSQPAGGTLRHKLRSPRECAASLTVNKRSVDTQALFDELDDNNFVSPNAAEISGSQRKRKPKKRASFAPDPVVREDSFGADQTLHFDDERGQADAEAEKESASATFPLSPVTANAHPGFKSAVKAVSPAETQTSFDLDRVVSAGVDLLGLNELI